MKKYLTLKEASDRTGISRAVLMMRIQRGELPAVDLRPPGSDRAAWRVIDQDLEAWLASKRRLFKRAVRNLGGEGGDNEQSKT